jgi:general secretion pathway protein A
MYLAFFGLAEKPFAITPDPRYLYLSARHADALAHLVYGINEAGGFIQLTGEVGTGKTTTVRSLLARAPKNAEIALILNPSMKPAEFLRSLCEELGLGTPDTAEGNTKELTDLLNRYLLRMHAEGRRVVLIVDEAQNLRPEVLEQVRLLTNLETETQKLLQIILIGQPELRTLLERNDLRQIAQRITGRYHLDPLSADETTAYIQHRLRVAGATMELFTAGALREVHRLTGGVPRLINIICDRALLGAYSEERHQVRAELVRRAAQEVFGHRVAPAWMPAAVAAAVSIVVITSALSLLRYWPVRHAATAGKATTTAAAPAPAGSAASVAAGGSTAVPASAGTAVPGTPAPGTPAPGAPAIGVPGLTPGTGVPGMGAPTQPTPAPSLALALQQHRAETDADAAFTALFGLWKVDYLSGSADGCTQAAAKGLSCFSQRGSLAQLRQFNRPAVLMLSDTAGTPYEVVLVALGDDTVSLRLGRDGVTVSIAELSRYWFGDFVLLWRPGVAGAHDLSAGMRGRQVQQLRAQLARWRGESPDRSAGDEFDSALLQQVEQFQRANHLAVDGVAGLETQLALDGALAEQETPVLHPGPDLASAARRTPS